MHEFSKFYFGKENILASSFKPFDRFMKVCFLIPFLFFIIACQSNDQKQVPDKIQKQAIKKEDNKGYINYGFYLINNFKVFLPMQHTPLS